MRGTTKNTPVNRKTPKWAKWRLSGLHQFGLHPNSDGLHPSSDGLHPSIAMASNLKEMANKYKESPYAPAPHPPGAPRMIALV